jgi:hypothetical protein
MSKRSNKRPSSAPQPGKPIPSVLLAVQNMVKDAPLRGRMKHCIVLDDANWRLVKP